MSKPSELGFNKSKSDLNLSNSKPEIKIKGKVQNMEKKEKNVKPKVSNFLLR